MPSNVCNIAEALKCCQNVSGFYFLKKGFSNVAEIKNVANAAEPTDVAVLSMSWVSFHLDYYARHVKLNV